MGQRGKGARPKQGNLLTQALPWDAPGLSRPERLITFLEFLPITKGIRAGQKMALLPSQREFVEAVYSDDSPVRLAVLSVPRGNGKTGLLSGLALAHLVGPECERRGEVYSAACDRAQAALLFAEMEAIIHETPEFDACINIVRFSKKLEVIDGAGKGSVYEALSADARRAQGLAPSVFVYVELAQARNGELLDNLVTGMGKRHRSLGIVISTQSPRDDHPLSQIIDDGLTETDPSVYVKLIAAPQDADPFDERTIRACNPAVGDFLDIDELLRQAEQAKRMPSFEVRFRNLRLNQRVGSESAFIAPLVWSNCNAKPLDEAFLAGPVRMGLDLSARHDLTALVYVADYENAVHVRCEFFAPEQGLHDRAHRDRAPYDVWHKQGLLTATPGASVDYEIVARRLVDLCDQYDVSSVAFDRWRIDVLQAELRRLNVELPLVPFGQGFVSMAPALDWLESEVLNKRLRHGDNPILNMCCLNSVVDSDPAGNRKLNKARSHGRIDGMVALAMCSHRQEQEPEQFVSGRLVFI